MATIRCTECNATHPVPAELTATSMTCPYCGATMVVPDAEARRRHQLELAREARAHEQHRAELAREARREAREEAERHAEKQERRRGRWGMRLMSLFAILLAPTIIAITVFDLPARLGFGASGAERLEQIRAQLLGQGCTVVRPIDAEYATGTVSKLIAAPAPPRCLRVLAAGAGDHRTLSLRLFDADGKEVASAKDTLDPQLTYCPRAAATLRYEIGVGPAAKGRLSHAVLACPAESEQQGKEAGK